MCVLCACRDNIYNILHVRGLEMHIAVQVWLKLATFPDWLGNEARLKQTALYTGTVQGFESRGIRNKQPQLCDLQMWSKVRGHRSKILCSYSNVVY